MVTPLGFKGSKHLQNAFSMVLLSPGEGVKFVHSLSSFDWILLCFLLLQVTPRSETPINSVSNSLENVLHTSTHSIEESLPKRPSGKHSKGVSCSACLFPEGQQTCIS